MVAGPEFNEHTLAYRFDDTRTIRHQHAPVGCGNATRGNGRNP